MPSALVLCAADPAADPRPNRMIRCLARDFSVGVISGGLVENPGVTCERIPPRLSRSLARRVGSAVLLLRGHYGHRVWTPGLRAIAAAHRRQDPAFITVHDLCLLPVALAIRHHGRVLFDAREYYPRHYEDLWWWRLLYQPLNVALCRKYLARADHIVTVSQRFASEYAREFGVHCEVLPSLPVPVACKPQPVDPDRLRMVHHGLASRSRRLEDMIRMMDRLPRRFSLDLILKPNDQGYVDQLTAMCKKRPNVRVLPPLAFSQLVVATNAYDIGLFLMPPVSFNLRFTVPNKLFEFVQARLMVAIGPSLEMTPYVRAHDLGVVAEDFDPVTLARALAGLSAADVARFKENAHRAAAVLNSDQTDAVVRSIALSHPASVRQ